MPLGAMEYCLSVANGLRIRPLVPSRCRVGAVSSRIAGNLPQQKLENEREESVEGKGVSIRLCAQGLPTG
jgi:hypothetical protein